MLAKRWRRLMTKLHLALPSFRDIPQIPARLIDHRQPALARVMNLSDARRRHRRLRRTAHRG